MENIDKRYKNKPFIPNPKKNQNSEYHNSVNNYSDIMNIELFIKLCKEDPNKNQFL